MRQTICVLAVLALGCAGVVVRTADETIVVSEWFRSGHYVVTDKGVEMETEAMSPVLGGVIAGAIVAGLPGAAVGGGVGLLKEGVDLVVDDAGEVVPDGD
jgi:hypothetical protein